MTQVPKRSDESLIERAATGYFNVLAAQDFLRFARAENEAVGRQLDQAKERFEVGLAAITDVQEAQARFGRPEIFNTDQGSQFTSTDFIKVLATREIKISMDGKGAWRDNVFVERLWRTIKYEEVYLRAYPSVSEARAGIGRYLSFYNSRRPHSSLDGKTPDQAYFNPPTPEAAAA